MSDWTTTATLAVGCVAALCIGRQALEGRASYPLPPGPPGLPWFGNVVGVDHAAPWKTYAKWARTYGDIFYSRLMGKDIIIINSEKIAKDLLEKRSRNYSDRPNIVSTQLCGLGFVSSRLPYGDRWRQHRRFFHQTFRLDAASRFWSIQHRKACQLLRQLLHNPDQLEDHLFEYTASVILNCTYNYDPASRKDELIDIVADTLDKILITSRPDVAIVTGAFPLLLHLPSWLPGMSFKKRMETARASSKLYVERPFEYSVKKMSSGSISPSMVHDALRHIEEKEVSPDDSWMEMLKGASGTAFLAGSETSNSVLMTFFLVMTLNPGAQERAQVQVDAVVGKDRLPTMDDRPLLPFVDAIFWETLRYNPVVPLSVVHTAVDDDVYGGYHIPKGARLLTNLWSMAHDESRFPNSHAFIPERFINEDGSLKPNEMEHITFGFGRRICVGRYFADSTVWTAIAKVLAVFKISKALDENGVEIPVEPRFSSGNVIHPLPFKFRIVPRFPGMDTEKLEKLITATSV